MSCCTRGEARCKTSSSIRDILFDCSAILYMSRVRSLHSRLLQIDQYLLDPISHHQPRVSGMSGNFGIVLPSCFYGRLEGALDFELQASTTLGRSLSVARGRSRSRSGGVLPETSLFTVPALITSLLGTAPPRRPRRIVVSVPAMTYLAA